MPTPFSSEGRYSSLPGSHQDNAEGQAFALEDSPSRHQNSQLQGERHSGSSDNDQGQGNDFRVTFMDDPIRSYGSKHGEDEDEEDEEEDEDEGYDDIVPLASSKRSYFNPSTRPAHPCRVLATVFGTAMIVSLAFALLSMLHLNNNDSLEGKDQDTPGQNETIDNRLLKPPAGVSVDDFQLSDFKLPPWDWDINTFQPIDITNGPKFTAIHWRNGEQYLAVECPQPYRYFFPSFAPNEFRNHASSVSLAAVQDKDIDGLLPLNQEPYVFVLCPPGKDNANVVFREFDVPEEPVPESPPAVAGTAEAPQPLLDDVVMLLVDAISRAKFTIVMKTVMEALHAINGSSTADSGHRIYDFEHYNVLGQNSPPNKAFIYSGQSIQNMNQQPKHWVWDTYEEQGFKTAHTDGECGGEQGIHDYTTGAITFEYSHLNNRIPAQYQMAQPSWCQNHDMHVVADVWGQSCVLPAVVHYDTALMGGMRWNTPYCAGEKAIHEHIMEDLEGWLGSTKGKRRFATYSFMDAHSPDHHHISFDRKLASLIQKLLVGQNGLPPLLSPNSALVIMADHGLHYGRETYTFPGFIHHKIPPLFVALPQKLLTARPDFAQALEQNQNRILSHLDLHQTFHHIAYGDQPAPAGESYADHMTRFIADGTFRQQFHTNAPNGTSYAQTYGRSLLLPIAEDRTCSTAGIPHDFCAFQPFLDLDPRQAVDATFLRQALLLLAKRMNQLTMLHHVDDVCHAASLTLEPALESGPSVTGSFDDIGTEDLVMESAYASALASKKAPVAGGLSEGRVFYFMVRDRLRPNRKYSITMKEDEVVMGLGDSITIQQMSAYASAWRPCAQRIVHGGKAVGKWQDVVKHFCVC